MKMKKVPVSFEMRIIYQNTERIYRQKDAGSDTGNHEPYNGCPAILEVQAGDCRVTVEKGKLLDSHELSAGGRKDPQTDGKNRRIRLYV